MKIIKFFIFLVFAPFVAYASDSDQAIEMFNGESLEGWNPVGNIEWQVEEAEIVADGAGNGFIVSQNQHQNFKLSLEYWIASDTNSGVFLGCNTATEINPSNCIEVNIWDDHPSQEKRTGSIVNHVMPPLVHVNTINQWNQLEISYGPNSISVHVNGVLTALAENVDTPLGYLALQHFELGAVKFRNITMVNIELAEISD